MEPPQAGEQTAIDTSTDDTIGTAEPADVAKLALPQDAADVRHVVIADSIPVFASPRNVAAEPPMHSRRFRRRVRAAHTRPETCHNCGFEAGELNFCGSCGQENIVPAMGLGEILRDAWDEFVKVDSKLVQTLIALVCHPGKLTADYIAGKRMRYIAPFRLYLTVSVLFFLVLTWKSTSVLTTMLGPEFIGEPVPVAIGTINKRLGHSNVHVSFGGLNGSVIPKSVAAYRVAQAALPPKDRQPAFLRFLNERMIGVQTRSVGDVLNDLLTTISRIMFVLLPAYALLLKMLYLRRRRLYVEHFVYALHIHTACFFVLLVYLLCPLPLELTVLQFALLIYGIIAMRRVYGQSIPKTLAKTVLLHVAYNIVLTIGTFIAVSLTLIL